MRNARNHKVQTSIDGGASWQLRGLFGSTTETILTGLTAGTMYTIRLRAVGGSTGYGDWSDPVSHMSL